MTNIELYINHNRVPCLTPINVSDIEVPKKISECLLYDNFLSEYNTEAEKKLIMLNILLLDNVPTEDSTRLVNSGTVYKIMREGKLQRDQLTELFNNLQRNKADKSLVLDISDLINNIKNKLTWLDNIEEEDVIEILTTLVNNVKYINPIPASKINNLFLNGTNS